MSMYCTDGLDNPLRLYNILAESLEENVYSIQESLIELKQLLTDLPHDMLEDSRDLSSPELNSSDCSVNELSNGAHQPWEHETDWNEHQQVANPQAGYAGDNRETPYSEQYIHKNLNEHGDNLGHQLNTEAHTNGWSDHQSEDEDESVYDINYSYPTRRVNEVPKGDAYHIVDDCTTEGHYQQSDIYHLPEDFQPYTNGHRQEFAKPQDGMSSFPDAQREHFQRLTPPDLTSNQPVESFQVKYNPYQVAMQHKAPFTQEDRSDERFEEMQREFLNPGENSSDKMQIAQLQVLYKARGRQLEELHGKLEESGRERRCLNHQLAMIRAEKDGLAVSLQELQKLFQNGREREVQFKGQIKALDANIQTLTANEEQMRKQLEVSEVALANMQQQLMDLRRSDSLKRAREQHEAVVTSLKQKSEEQLLLLQQKLDVANTALQEQKELCCCLEDHVKQLERKQEENKLEKNEIINRLTRSLEESQTQCANLLQTGTIQEMTQLRFQLQQAQSSKIISDNMNKSLQEELTELKEQVTLYESAAKLGVYLNGSGGEAVDLSESYVDLGIQNVNWKKSRFHSVLRKKDLPVDLTKDEIIMELKVELERSLGSNKVKRHQVSQLQLNLKEHQGKIEELKKQLGKVERTARDYEVSTDSMAKHMDTVWPHSSVSIETLKEEIQKLKIENQALQHQVEKHLCCIQELTLKEENLKIKNQELCNEMRQMIEDFDRDKQEAIDRCERTYQQHHEDIKNHLHKQLSETYVMEKEQLRQTFEEKMLQIQAQLDQKDQAMTAVQECYITVCREKDSLEDTLKKNLSHELTATEEKFKEQLLKEKDECLRILKEKHQSELASARNQWLKDQESDLKRAVEAQVVLARTHWEEEQRKMTEKAIQETEKEWQHRLDKTVEEMKKVPLVNLKDCEIQTEPNKATDQFLSKELVEELQLKLENALQDKEKAIRQAVVELEIQHHENISHQVEAALNNAHIRWLQELTSLAEYKVALKAEQEKWEKENELIVAKQISAVLTTAEEKWKRDHIKQLGTAEKPWINVKQKELEEKMTSLTRELESKNEEHAARVKAELAKARAEWNKEKQEEINRIRGQNEKDYRTFLDDHRNKINEVLAQAKEDFERQKQELLIQKENDIKECLEQNRKEWVTREAKKLQQHENEMLSSLEYFLGKVHLELVKGKNDKCTLNENPPIKTINLSIQYQEKLMDCLQKSCQEIVYKCIDNAKQEWKKKNGAYTPDRKTVAGDDHRRLHVEAWHRTYLLETKKTSESQDMSMETDQSCTKIGLSPQDYYCCEHCFQELEKSKSECRELKSKLEKACRHLQLAVKEQKVKGEQVKENESIVQALKKENNEVQKKYEEMKACVKTKNRLQSEEAGGNSCTFCCGKGLEEMRAQYITAVDKIRGDMLRYIQESRERAAEMLKAEVLRERQETARKMRKYYLICLQQLLKDDGKHEGAEKKIMNAASKLATMAKVLETPITHKSHDRHTRTTHSQNVELPARVVQGGSCGKVQTHSSQGDSRSKDQSGSKKNNDQSKYIPLSLDQKLIDGMTPDLKSVPYEEVTLQARNEKIMKGLVCGFVLDEDVKERSDNVVKAAEKYVVNSTNATTLQNPTSCIKQVKLKNVNAYTWIDGLSDSESDHVPFHIQTKQPTSKEFIPNHHKAYARATSQTGPRFDIQETPVRDESRPNDWSLLSENLKLDSNALLHPVQKETSVKSANTQAQSCSPFGQFSAVGLRSTKDESVDMFGRHILSQNNPLHSVKRKATNWNKEHLSEITGHNLHQNSNCVTDLTKRSNFNSNSNVARAFLPHSRQLIMDVGSVQQDSGFDSPLPNITS